MDGKPRQHECHNETRWTRNHRHWNLDGNGASYQRKTWIRDARRARVGDNGHRFSLLEQLFDALTGALLIMFMEGKLWLLDIKMLEQQPGFACIFAGNDIDR